MKRQNQSPSRFEAGTYGRCDAMFFGFHEQRPPEAHVVRIAVTGSDEELAYLPWVDPAFGVASVQNFGLNVTVSGSPLD